jgi:uncharacterized protein
MSGDPMRFDHGKIELLEENEVLKTLERGSLGHLGCFSSSEVYVVPITYVFENPYIYSHSKDGKKISMMRKNPSVCIEVEEIETMFSWQSAIAWGTYEELKNNEAATAMRLLIKKITDKIADGSASSLEVDFDAIFEDAIIYRIRIDKLSGRYEDSTSSLSL